MSDRKQKLELTWIGKEKRPKLEPRILLENQIPRMVLARCEWGRDDYSLNVANLPMAQVEHSRSL